LRKLQKTTADFWPDIRRAENAKFSAMGWKAYLYATESSLGRWLGVLPLNPIIQKILDFL
jgi:hypothetical protein